MFCAVVNPVINMFSYRICPMERSAITFFHFLGKTQKVLLKFFDGIIKCFLLRFKKNMKNIFHYNLS